MKKLVIIPGWCGNENMPAALAAALQPEFDVDTWSLDQLFDGNYDSLDGYADTAADRLHALDQSAVLVGWSMGGLVAMEAAAAAHPQVACLVLLASTARFVRDEDNPKGVALPILRAMKAGMHIAPVKGMVEFLKLVEYPEKGILSADADMWYQDPELRIHGLRYLAEQDCRKLDLPMPMLSVVGMRDKVIHPESSRSLIRHYPGCEERRLEASGHAFPIAQADEAAQLITGFAS